ncbi:MAG: cellulase family glycosylhydrolase [Bacteriovoracaceae bacterium]
MNNLLKNFSLIFLISFFFGSCEEYNGILSENSGQGPSINFISPVPGSQISGVVEFKVAAKDANGVASVSFEMADKLNRLDQEEPYSVEVDTSELVNGLHELEVAALNNNGIKTSRLLHFKVSNEVEDDENEDNSSPSLAGDFVTVKDGKFKLKGKDFYFSGTNAYYLPNYEKLDPKVVDRAFSAFEDAGVKVVRMWAFYDGYEYGYSAQDKNENVIQTAAGVYNEKALKDLDNVIAKGKVKNMYFVLALANYWKELGGVAQYVKWAGISNPEENTMQKFLASDKAKKLYKDYVRMLLNRVNTVTGVAYKNEPAIMAWHILNEGRGGRGEDPTILRDFYQEMARFIKDIDANHLVGTGEEGYDHGQDKADTVYSRDQYSNTYALRANEGTSYILNTSIPEIDFGSFHLYPSVFGFGSDQGNILKAQSAWIKDHYEIAKNLGKPALLGEYGYPGWGDKDKMTPIYQNIYQNIEQSGLGGGLFWQLTADWHKCWEYGGNICYPAGRKDTELFNGFKAHNLIMNAKGH